VTANLIAENIISQGNEQGHINGISNNESLVFRKVALGLREI
jgi:hypothetical protein